MKRFLKSVLMLLSAGFFAMVGKAAEPIATWTNFSAENLTQGGFTLNLNGNTAAEDGSSVTIGETAGLTVSGLDIQNWAIVVDVENAPATGMVLDAKLKNSNYIGLYSTNNNLKCRWTNNLSWGACKDNWAPTNRQLITMTYSYAGVNGSPTGTSIYINGAFVVSHTGLRTSSNLDSFVIGLDAQSRTEENLLATGMKVYSVRLYDTRLLDAEAPNYQTLSSYAKYSPVHTAKTLAADKQFHKTVFTRMTDGVDVDGSSNNNWRVFASQIKSGSWGPCEQFGQDGATLRLTTPAASTHAFNASYSPLSFTGLIVEAGATGYSFENGDTGEDARRCELGNRVDQTATSYFTLHENFTIKRSDMHLYGPCVFEIDNGKTFTINTSHTTRPVVVKENASVTLTNGGLLKIMGNLKLENGTTLNGHTNASAATTSDAGTIQITNNVLVNSGASIGGSGTINCVLKLADGANLDASQGMLKANEVWMLSGAPNATVTLPADAADGTAILACKNASVTELVNDLTTKVAAKGFKCVAVEEGGYKVIKLARIQVTVTLPTVENAKWLYNGNEVSGFIKVDPNQNIILTLQPGDLYVFAGGVASQTVPISVGNTDVTVDAETLDLLEVVAAKAAIGNVKYASIGAACEAADADDVIVLLQDLEFSETKVMNFDKTITLDLNGKTQTATANPAIKVTSGTLNLVNNNSDEDATITAPGVVIQQGVKNADPATETTVNIGKDVILISANETADDGDNVVLLYGKATLTSEGVLSTISQKYAAIQGSGGDTTADTSITINGGSVTSWFNHAIYQPQAGTVTINGGTIEGFTGIEMRAGTLTVNGGTITSCANYAVNKNGNGSTVIGAAIAVSPHAGVESITANINGGKIGDDETAKALAIVNTIDAMPPAISATIAADATIDMDKVEVDISDLEFKENNGSYALGMKTTGAIIKNEWYETLQAAINAAAPGDRVILLGDVTASEIITINKAVTLEGKGKTLTSTAGRAINVDCAGAVTIEDLTIVAAERAINIINQPATVAISEVTATADNVAVMIATSAGAAQVAIADSELTGLMVVAVYGAEADVTIDGSTITNVDANKNENYGAITLGDTADKATVAVKNTTITVADDSKKVYNFTSTATITGVDEVGVVVAMIGEAGYDTIEEAAKDVKAGQTIVLKADVTVDAPVVVPAGATLDLNGKASKGTVLGTIAVNGGKYITAEGQTVIGTDARTFESTDAVFTMDAVSGNISLDAGTVTAKDQDSYGNNWTLPGQTLTIKAGVTLNVPAGVTMQVNSTTVTIEMGAMLNIAGGINLYTADATITAAEGLTVTTTVAGYEVKYVEGVYTVVESVVIEDVIAKTPAAEAIKAAMQDAGVTKISSYTITTKGTANAAAEVAAVADVLAVFDVEPTVAKDGTLTVAYEFGISKVENKGNGFIEITASVNDGAEIRDGVAVVFYADEDVIDSTLSEDDKTASISVSADSLKGKKITVKASNEVRFE